MGSYHQRSERFLTRNSSDTVDNPLHGIFGPKQSKKKYFASILTIFCLLCVFWVDVGLFFVAFSRNMGSYHQRSDRFLTRNNAESKISIIGRPSATPLYDIGVEIRPMPKAPPKKSKKKYFASKVNTCLFKFLFFVNYLG